MEAARSCLANLNTVAEMDISILPNYDLYM